MPMYNVVEYSGIYSKTTGSLWPCYRDDPVIDKNNNIIDFSGNNNNGITFKF